jgi:hypothetical protein|nr:MAG TPA: hypothetical protein [Caudoviricetes sp.]
MTRKEELEKLLDKECPKYEDNCGSCPYSKECEEYHRLAEKCYKTIPCCGCVDMEVCTKEKETE